MTKVAFVLTQDRGGPVDVTVALAAELVTRGVKVAVFGPAPANPAAVVGLRHVPVAVGSKLDVDAMIRLAAQLRSWEPDVTHAQDRRAALAIASPGLARGLGATVWTYHGVPYDVSQQWFSGTTRSRAPSRYSRAVLTADALVARRMRRVIAPSLPMQRFLRGRLRVPAIAVAHIPNGVSLPDAEVLSGPVRRLVFIGGLEPVKGVLDLLAALSRPGVFPPDATLDIIGDGPERQRAMVAAARPPLAGKVRFLGFRPAAADLLAGYDALVMASRIEQQPLVVVQAMAAGRLVLATRVGDIPDMVDIDGFPSFLAPPGDTDALAAELTRLFSVSDPFEASRRLAARARERYSAARSADAHLTLYHSLTAVGTGHSDCRAVRPDEL